MLLTTPEGRAAAAPALRRSWRAVGLLALVSVAACGEVKAPVADAGPDRQVAVGAALLLDGSGSRDPHGLPLTYRWRVVEAPEASAAALQSGDGITPAQARLVPDVAGRYRVELVVDNGEQASPPDEVVLDAACRSSLSVTAAMDGAATGPVGVAVRLVAEATYSQPEGCRAPSDSTRLAWRFSGKPAGSASQLSPADATMPQLLPDLPGTYVVRVDASGPQGQRASASVTFEAACGAAPPVVDSFDSQPPEGLRVDVPVLLRGSVSDPDLDPACPAGERLRTEIAVTQRPAGSRATLRGATDLAAELVPDQPGTYRVRLRVWDRREQMDEAEVTLQVGRCGAQAPAIAAVRAEPVAPPVGAAVQLAADVSDPDQAADCGLDATLIHRWTLVAQPAGSLAQIVPPDGERPWIIPDQPGVYRVRLTVEDEAGLYAVDELELTASPCGDGAPTVALLAEPASPHVGQWVRVRAVASDPDALDPCRLQEDLQVSLRAVELPAGAAELPEAPGAELAFEPAVAGVYRLEAVATDPRGHQSAPARLDLRVEPCGGGGVVVDALAAAPEPAVVGAPLRLSATIGHTDRECLLAAGEPDPLATLTYRWELLALPAGSEVELVGAEGAEPWLVPDRPGEVRVGLRVWDARGGPPARVERSVLVGACGSFAPSATIEAQPAAPLVGSRVHLLATLQDADTQAPCAEIEHHELRWSLLEAPAGFAAASARLDLRRPWLEVTHPGRYAVRLDVTDAAGHPSAPAVLELEVGPCGAARPEVAAVQAEPAQPTVGALVAFDATVTDADREPGCGLDQTQRLSWRLLERPFGSSAALQPADAERPWLRADESGRYVVGVAATDSSGRRSVERTVTVEASECGGRPPRIEALGSDPAEPGVGVAVRLSATVVDPDGTDGCVPDESATLVWRLVELPAGSRARLHPSAGPAPSLLTDQPGRYAVSVTATDAEGNVSPPAELAFDATACGSWPPVVEALNATPAQPSVGQPLSLAATVSDRDASECGLPQATTVSWRLLIAPAGSQARLSDPGAERPSLLPDLPGLYLVQAEATDDAGVTSTPATLALTLLECGAAVPEVALDVEPAAGPRTTGQPVDLRATVLDADLLPPCELDQQHTYRFLLLQTPMGSRVAVTSYGPGLARFVPDVDGQYLVQVVAADDTGRSSAPATAMVIVDTACGASPPLVVAGDLRPSPQVDVGREVVASVLLDDPDNQPGCDLGQHLTARWELLDLPAGSQASLSATEVPEVTFVPDLPGRYALLVRAEDSSGLVSEATTLEVEAVDCGGRAPVASVSRAQPLPEVALQRGAVLSAPACVGAPFLQLDASGSVDADRAECAPEQWLSWDWQVRATPPGATLEVLRPTSANPSLRADGEGRYAVDLWVQDSTGRRSERFPVALDVTLLPPPQPDEVLPSFFCAQEVEVLVEGDHFYTVRGELPVLLLGGIEVPATRAEICNVALPDLGIERCRRLRATIPADFPVDGYALRVRNPFPLGCTSDSALSLLVAGAPEIEATVPSPVCRGEFDGALVLRGTGFFTTAAGLRPTVTLNGVPVPVLEMLDCAPVLPGVEICEGIRLQVPALLRDRDLTIRLTNPAPANCEIATFLLRQEEPPRIDDVQPRKVCFLGGELTLTGEHFEPGMRVRLGLEPATSVEVEPGGHVAHATWEQRLQPGLYVLDATNPGGCDDTFEAEIRVTEGPFVFFVDPLVAYDGISLQATVYLGNLYGGSVTGVRLTGPQGELRDLEFGFEPQRPNRVRAVLPAGLPPGAWDVTVFDDVGCPGTTEDLLTVTDRLSVAVQSVDPPFGWTDTNTAVTVLGPEDPGELQPFQPTPRAYINPTVPGPDDRAAELLGLTYHAPGELHAIVGPGLRVGQYDLVVVNPDGGVGLLREAFRVTAAPPPEIDVVSPGSWETNYADLPIQVAGRGFRNVRPWVQCREPGGQTPEPPVEVANETPTLLDLLVDTTTIAHMSVCLLRVYNDDDSYADYAPVTVTNRAGKFVDFVEGVPLPAPRRAPVVAAAAPSRAARFLYVLGGDAGDPDEALSSGLYSGLDTFGAPGRWEPLPQGLPLGLSLAKAAVIRDFIYVVGGHRAGAAPGPIADVQRALVLDPLHVPLIESVDFTFDPAREGLATGVYYYRVAAVMRAEDPANPGGETLASDPQPVYIPDLQVGLTAVLEWSELGPVAGWRVYRSLAADLPYGNEVLLAELPPEQRRLEDDGTLAAGADRPLPVGALGEWHVVAQMSTPRRNHGVAVAADPEAAGVQHIYAVGGDAGAAPLGSIDHTVVRVLGPRDQVVVQALPLGQTISPPRTELEAVVVDPSTASSVPAGEAYLFVLSGIEAGGGDSRAVEAARILPGGGVLPFSASEQVRPSHAGYAAAAANNTLVVVGGQGGLPSNTARAGELCGDCGSPPVIERWSSLSNVNLQARYLHGRAVFSGFLYVVGGVGGDGAPTATMDYTVLGGVP